MSAQVTTPNGHTPTAAPAFSEAPASATVKVTTPGGYDLMITFRATRVADLLSQAQTVETWLIAHNFTPAPAFKGKPAQDAANGVSTEAAPVCAIHGKPMTRRTTKDGTRSFWSCSEKLADGTWCPYRPKAGQP